MPSVTPPHPARPARCSYVPEPRATLWRHAKPTVFGAFDYLRTPAMQQEIARRYRSAWEDFQTLLRDNLDVVTGAGPKALQDHWTRLQGGEVNPRQGVVVTFPHSDAP